MIRRLIDSWRDSVGIWSSGRAMERSPRSIVQPGQSNVRLPSADALRQLGIDVRIGLHTGEIERRGDYVAGIAVHLAQRVQAIAQPGEVLVSRTVVDLVVGSDLHFADRGEHELNGLPGMWRLFLVGGRHPTRNMLPDFRRVLGIQRRLRVHHRRTSECRPANCHRPAHGDTASHFGHPLHRCCKPARSGSAVPLSEGRGLRGRGQDHYVDWLVSATYG